LWTSTCCILYSVADHSSCGGCVSIREDGREGEVGPKGIRVERVVEEDLVGESDFDWAPQHPYFITVTVSICEWVNALATVVYQWITVVREYVKIGGSESGGRGCVSGGHKSGTHFDSVGV
jgi:hypothetical protein